MTTWTPRGEVIPQTIDEMYEIASNLEIYGDSGICRHLPYLKSMPTESDTVLELGTGGADQSTVAWLASRANLVHSIHRQSVCQLIQKVGV
jgi:hypothetical protein